MTERKAHWEEVWRTRASTEVSWFQPEPARALALLEAAGVGPGDAVIDVGSGDAPLVDALLARGIRVTVLDVSAAALERVRGRLGERAADVAWIEADVTSASLPRAGFDAWHDRAVFHFLTDPGERRRYAAAARDALRPGGTLVVATFAPEGPTRCSGLAVVRYSAESLARELGDAFALRDAGEEVHRTPAGAEQRFTWVVLTRC